MANRYTIASGFADDPAIWDGGVSVPVSGDRVLISHTSTANNTFSTNTAGYAIGSTNITLTGTVSAGSYVIGEKVSFGTETTDNPLYTITGWNSGTRVLTIDPPLSVAIPAVATLACSRGHEVTLRTAVEWGDDSTATIVINTISTTNSITIRGILRHSRVANSSITCLGNIRVVAFGTHDVGYEANPIPFGVTATLIINKSGTLAASKYSYGILNRSRASFWGGSKVRAATLTSALTAGATTVYVSQASGWKIGDKIVIAGTSNADNSYSHGTIAGTYVEGSTTVPLTAAVQSSHLNGADVANVTSNVRATPFSQSFGSYWFIDSATDNTSLANSREFGDIELDQMTGGSWPYSGVTLGNATSYNGTYNPKSLRKYFSVSHPLGVGNTAGGYWNAQTTFHDGIQYIDSCVFTTLATANTNAYTQSGSNVMFDNCLFIGVVHASSGWYNNRVRNSTINGRNSVAGIVSSWNSTDASFENVHFYGRFRNNLHFMADPSQQTRGFKVINCTFGFKVINCTFGIKQPLYGLSKWFGNQTVSCNGQIEFIDCEFSAAIDALPRHSSEYEFSILAATAYFKLTNVNKDVNRQEYYNKFGFYLRNNTLYKNSTSSVEQSAFALNVPNSKTQSITVAAGATIRVVGYVRIDSTFYNSGNLTYPTVTLSGAGLTTTTFTATSASLNAWEQFDISITNTAGYAQAVTLSQNVTPLAVVGGRVYFAGVPDGVYVTKARHYGFMFEEALPTRTVNSVLVADEATAYAYTGVSMDSVTPRITVTAGTADSFLKVYEYTQAWAVNNLDNDVLLTSTDGNNFTLATTTKLVWDAMGADGTLVGGWWELTTPATYNVKLSGTKIEFKTAGTYDFSAGTVGGTVELVNTSGGNVTVVVPAGTSYTNTGPNITVTEPVVARGLAFTGLLAGSTLKVFETGTQTELFSNTNTATSVTWSEALSGSRTVDYTILKDGYLPIRQTGIVVTGAVVGGVMATPIQQAASRAWVTPIGLTFGTNLFYNPTTKLAGLTAVSTLQNLYCQLISSFRTEATLQNKPFPMTENGPNSFRWIDGSGFDLTTYANSISNLRGDGMSYTDVNGNVTDVWAAILSVGVPAGFQVRYQQQDGIGTTNAQNTGNIDQLIKIKKTGTGAFDYTNWLVLKVQEEGYDQAEAVAQDIYGVLEDQLYVVGLTPLPNSIAAGLADATVTVTPEPTPVLWNGSYFSTTITDTTDNHSGLAIMQAVRAANEFNWSDLVRPNGDKFKTVTGNFYGDAYATPAGVRVVMSDGTTPHPDFNLFNDDTGSSPYVPPVIAPITWEGAVDGTTILLYNDSNAGAIIDTQNVSGAGGYVWSVSLPYAGVAVGDSLRLRYGHKEYYAGELQGTLTASGIAFVGSMTLHPVYAGWGLDGSVYDQANGGPFTMDGLNLEIDIGGGAGTGTKKALAAWTQHLMTLPAGLDAFYGAWDLLDLNMIRQNVAIVDVLIDKPTAGEFVFTDNDINYYRSDFTIPYNTTHSTIFMTYNAKPFVATVVGGNVITGDISTVMSAVNAVPAATHTLITTGDPVAPTASEVAGEVLAVLQTNTLAVNMVQVKGQSLVGTGIESDPWSPA